MSLQWCNLLLLEKAKPPITLDPLIDQLAVGRIFGGNTRKLRIGPDSLDPFLRRTDSESDRKQRSTVGRNLSPCPLPPAQSPTGGIRETYQAHLRCNAWMHHSPTSYASPSQKKKAKESKSAHGQQDKQDKQDRTSRTSQMEGGSLECCFLPSQVA